MYLLLYMVNILFTCDIQNSFMNLYLWPLVATRETTHIQLLWFVIECNNKVLQLSPMLTLDQCAKSFRREWKKQKKIDAEFVIQYVCFEWIQMVGVWLVRDLVRSERLSWWKEMAYKPSVRARYEYHERRVSYLA